MPRALAIDVGRRHIGLAVSDESMLIARPLTVIDVKRGAPIAATVQVILAHAAAQCADQIIIGHPLLSDGRAGEQAHFVEGFAAQLRPRTTVPVQLYDERFSTEHARQIILTKKRKRRDARDDAIAAAVILQRWLDERRAAQDDGVGEPIGALTEIE